MRLSEGIELLRSAGVDFPRYDAEQIFMNFGGVSAADCKLSDPECLSSEVVSAIERRAGREPLQYILGFADFYRERYRVSPACLIPRSDTENLVDFAVKNIPRGENILDLCTGSGCIGISTVKNTVDTNATLVDISPEALALAEENAKENGVSHRVTARLADLMSFEPKGQYFAILSNPPYVRPDEYDRLEREIYFEPKIAFLGGEDGMDFYKRILKLGKGALKPEGFIALEIGYTQGAEIRELGEAEGFSVQIIKDLGGNDRVAVLKEA